MAGFWLTVRVASFWLAVDRAISRVVVRVAGFWLAARVAGFWLAVRVASFWLAVDGAISRVAVRVVSEHSPRLVIVQPPSTGGNLDNTHLLILECWMQILWEIIALS